MWLVALVREGSDVEWGRAEAFVPDLCPLPIAHRLNTLCVIGVVPPHDNASGNQGTWAEAEVARDGRSSLPEQARVYVQEVWVRMRLALLQTQQLRLCPDTTVF